MYKKLCIAAAYFSNARAIAGCSAHHLLGVAFQVPTEGVAEAEGVFIPLLVLNQVRIKVSVEEQSGARLFDQANAPPGAIAGTLWAVPKETGQGGQPSEAHDGARAGCVGFGTHGARW